MCSSARRSRWDCISSPSSFCNSARRRPNTRAIFENSSRMGSALRREDPRHGVDETPPFGAFGCELLAAERGEAVIACAPAVGSGFPARLNPLALEQALEGGVEG